MLRALADCNNFYASCERALNPALEGVPVIVLSNNDGCIVARSSEAKALGIPMGAPFFQVRRLCETHGVHVASSNFAVYGDFSARVMEVLAEQARDIEVYSIDEAFLGFPDMPDAEAEALGRRIREEVRARTGIGVSIGLAPTLLLCKLANELAKGDRTSGGVRVVPSDPAARLGLLRPLAVDRLWGVGPGLAARLRAHAIVTVADLAEAEPARVRSFAGVVGERLALEARGVPCRDLVEEAAPRRSILSSRSFGHAVTDRAELGEAIAYHATQAARKLREDGLVASEIVGFARTNQHRPDEPQRRAEAAVRLDPPTQDARRLAAAAADALDRLWEPGFRWKKAGVFLLGLSPADRAQPMLPGLGPGESEARRRLMVAMDALNAKLGRDVVRLASTGLERAWKGKSERLTELSTTDAERLPVAKADGPRLPRTRIRFHE